MGKPHRKPLDEKSGEILLNLFKHELAWKPVEAPLELSSILGLVRQKDTIAIFISGSSTNPQLTEELENIIAGIDVLTHETNPNVSKGEPPGNAYHYVLQKITDESYPYILYGPFDHGTIISHWYDDNEIDVYP